MIETYRLYEFAHFLKISEQLPAGAMSELSVGDVAEISETCPPSSTMVTLDDCQLKELDKYYGNTDKQYHALILRYTEERKHARRLRKLRDFPEFSQWSPKEGPLLSQEEKQMCSGPTPQALKLSSWTCNGKHGRTVRLTSKEADEMSSGCKSSFVYLSKSEALKETLFGQILFVFQHSFRGSTSVLAYVNWFEKYHIDKQSNLIYVNQESQSKYCPVVPVSQLSKPLVTASDPENSNQLWILNFQP